MNIKYASAESDIFVGRRSRLQRYLVCSLQGYFPVLAKMDPKSLAVIYRTGGTHVSLSATVAVSTSRDGGKSWSDPLELTPRWQDARNPALGVNDRGELVAAFWKAQDCYKQTDGLAKWVGGGNVVDYGASCFTTISADGKVWSQPIPMKFTHLRHGCPYGRIITASDGTLLMSIYGTPVDTADGKDNAICLIRSRDGGRTWGDESLVARDFNETSFVYLSDGTLAAAARNWSRGAFVAILKSRDGGYTWSEPKQVTRNAEHPADLTMLQSGRLLLTFGRRVRPMGCGALISDDLGETWRTDREILLAGDGIANGDLGYPSTVQMDDGTIVTVLYYASGSEVSAGHSGWGDVSCQAIHYREEDIE